MIQGKLCGVTSLAALLYLPWLKDEGIIHLN